MAEDNPALPGWVDERLDEIFAGFPPELDIKPHREAYADCLAQVIVRGQPAIEADAAGEAARATCREQFIIALESIGIDRQVLDALNQVLEVVEDDLAEDT